MELTRSQMAWIENVSMDNVRKAHHYDPGENSMLISIVDPGHAAPNPLYPFKEKHYFQFLDTQEIGEESIQPGQAACIAELLLKAADNKMNVVVHCHAGLCRSGAVVEAGILAGLAETDRIRVPNGLVKKLIINAMLQAMEE